MASILLNSLLFFKDDKRGREEFIKSFEWCNKKINLLYSQSQRNELVQKIEETATFGK